MTRVCSVCEQVKDEKLFYRHLSIKPDGIRKQCNDCRKKYRKRAHIAKPEINRKQKNNWRFVNKDEVNNKAREYRKHNFKRFKGYKVKKEFGITLEEVNKMLKEQNYVCKICNKPETAIDPRTNKTKALSIDHNHKTGKIRGLLCWPCNTAIGKFLDSPDLLLKASQYVLKDGVI